MALPTDLSCEYCDESRRIAVRILGQIVMVGCVRCTADRISLCIECGENEATHIVQGDRVCDSCDPVGAAEISRNQYLDNRADAIRDREAA